jgi:hypothetical protein
MLWHNLQPCPLNKLLLNLYVTHFWEFGETPSFLSANLGFQEISRNAWNQAYRNMAKCRLPLKNSWRFANKKQPFFRDPHGILQKIDSMIGSR